ncbi:MAG TPA: ERF family protein, partial [Microbacterium sp.]|nr:ERF family protein [Microbacterium sp.]
GGGEQADLERAEGDGMTTAHVYEAINKVTAVMATEGIAKGRKNDQQGYRFRGIDDVYNAIARPLADAKLCILPRVVERTVTERPTKSGGVSTYVVLEVEFDLVSAVDGSKHTIRTMGEAMDTADKATNKAMSAAMKYACMLAFQIPTEGDNDADAHHPEPSDLTRKLSASIEWGQWEKAQGETLRESRSMGELQERWASAYETGQKSPNGTLKRLGEIKDEMKKRLGQPRTEARP